MFSTIKYFLIKGIYFRSYQTYDNTNDIYRIKLFSIKVQKGSGKHRFEDELVAISNKATGIYHFDDKRFCTEDEMLTYVLKM